VILPIEDPAGGAFPLALAILKLVAIFWSLATISACSLAVVVSLRFRCPRRFAAFYNLLLPGPLRSRYYYGYLPCSDTVVSLQAQARLLTFVVRPLQPRTWPYLQILPWFMAFLHPELITQALSYFVVPEQFILIFLHLPFPRLQHEYIAPNAMTLER